MAEPVESRTNKSVDIDAGAGGQSIVPDPDLSATTSADAYDAIERIRATRDLDLGGTTSADADAGAGMTDAEQSERLFGRPDVVAGQSAEAEAPSHLQRIERDLDVGDASVSDAAGDVTEY